MRVRISTCVALTITAISLLPQPQARAMAQAWEIYRGYKPEKVRALAGPGRAAGAVAFSPDGSSLIVGLDDGVVLRYDAATGRQDGIFPAAADHAPVHAIAFSPVGRMFAVATPVPDPRAPNLATEVRSPGDAVSIRDQSGREVRKLSLMAGQIIVVAFAADGKRVAAMDHTYGVKVWQVADGREVIDSQVHRANGRQPSSAASRAGFSADLTRAVVLNDATDVDFGEAARGNAVRLWEAGVPEPRVIPMNSRLPLSSVVITGDGSRVFTSVDYHITMIHEFATIRHLGMGSEQIPRSVPAESRRVTFLALSPDNRRIVEGTKGGFVCVNDLESKKGGHLLFEGPRGYVRAVSFLPDGVRIASGGWEPLGGAYDAPRELDHTYYEPIMLWEVKGDGT